MAEENFIDDSWSNLGEFLESGQEVPIGTPPPTGAEKFSKAFSSGLYGLGANVNYMQAAWDALTQDQEGLEQNLQEAQRLEEIAAYYLQGTDTESFSEFWDNKTASGFLDQTILATGQFAPSAIASITAMAIGAAVAAVSAPVVAGAGIVAGATGAAFLRGASLQAAKRLMKRAWTKRARGIKSKGDEWDEMVDKSYPLMQKLLGKPGATRRGRIGGVIGAASQEYTQGTGITFGEYSRQGMTDPASAAKSFAIGIPYAALGLAGEAAAGWAVLKPLMAAAKKAAKTAPASAGYKSLVADLAKAIPTGFAIGALGEGATEAAQEGISIAQRFSIDPEYTGAEAKMDALEAAFMGFMGGGVLGGGGRAVTTTARNLMDRTLSADIDDGRPEATADEAAQDRDLEKVGAHLDEQNKKKSERKIKGTEVDTKKEGDEHIEFPDLETPPGGPIDKINNQIDEGRPVPETIKDVMAQIVSMLTGSDGRNSVWIEEGQSVPTQKEIDEVVGEHEVFSDDIAGRGKIISLDKSIVEDVVNNKADKSSLARALKMLEPQNTTHDVVFVARDKDGNELKAETTNEANQETVKENLQREYPNAEIEGPLDPTEVQQERIEKGLEEGELQAQQALSEIANVDENDNVAVARVLERHWGNYTALKRIYDGLRGKNDPRSVEVREILEERLNQILKEHAVKIMQDRGISDPKILVQLGLEEIVKEAQELSEQEGKETSPTGRAAEEAELFGEVTIQEQEVTVVGQGATIGEDAKPWKVGTPELDTEEETATRMDIIKEIFSLLTPEERTRFLLVQEKLEKIGKGYPKGVLTAFLELRKAEPTTRLDIVFKYTDSDKSIPYNPIGVIQRYPALAKALGLSVDNLGVTIEINRDPSATQINVAPEGAEPKRLSLKQYFQRALKIANESTQEYRESGFFVRRPGINPKTKKPYKLQAVDMVRLIWEGKRIVTAEKDYVVGDLKQALRSFHAILGVGAEFGYDFFMQVPGIKEPVPISEVTDSQLKSSKLRFYVKGNQKKTLGQFLSSKYVIGGASSYQDLKGHVKALTEAILAEQNEETKYPTMEALFEEVQKRVGEKIELETNEKGQEFIVPQVQYEGEAFAFSLMGVMGRKVEHIYDFLFTDIADALYDIAKEEAVSPRTIEGIESSFTGLPDEERATELRTEPGMDPESSIRAAIKAEGGEGHKPIYRTDREVQDGAKEQDLITKPKGDTTSEYSSDFYKTLGALAKPLTNALNTLNYFGINKFGKKIIFLTHNDVINGSPEKDKLILKNKKMVGHFQNWIKSVEARKEEGRRQAGMHIRTDNGNTHVIIIDPTPIMEARKAMDFGEFAGSETSQNSLVFANFKVMTTIAHEIGHAIALVEIDSLLQVNKKGIKDKLRAEFEKVKDAGPSQYKEPGGFEEWIADQTAAWLINYARNGKLDSAKTGVDSFFRNLVKKIIKVWDTLVKDAPYIRVNIKDPNQAFTQFADNIVKSMKNTKKFERETSGKLTFDEQDAVNSMVEQAVKGFNYDKKTYKVAVKKVAEYSKGIIENNPKIVEGIRKFFQSAEKFVEGLGPAGKLIRDFFYGRSQAAKAGLAWIAARDKYTSQFLNSLSNILGLDTLSFFSNKLSKEQEAALLDADNDTIADADLKTQNPMAWEIRMFLRSFYTNYITEKGPDGKPLFKDISFLQTLVMTEEGRKIASYFPRSFRINEILNNGALRTRFQNLIEEKLRAGKLLVTTIDKRTNKRVVKVAKVKKGKSESAWAQEYVNKLLRLDPHESSTEAVSREHDNLDLASIELGMPASLGRTLKFQVLEENELSGVPAGEYGFTNKELRDAGLLETPTTALMNYIRQTVKRVELEKRGGAKYIEELISELPEDKQVLARDAVRAMLGKVTSPMNPLFRKFNSWGLFANVVTTLTFAVFASFPDLAGPFLRSKEWGSLKTGFDVYRQYFRNREEAVQFAMDIGAVSQDTLSIMYIHASEMDYMTAGSKRLTDAFFKAIMLDQFTKFTRVFAAQMGKRFLVRLAHDNITDPARMKRWLAELGGITKEEILAWEKGDKKKGIDPYDFSTPEGKKAADAVYIFVDESIIRPNAAQRPVWASNPYFALVWQLKGFFYAYGKTIVGGQYRETINRYKEAGIGSAAVPISMMALTILPLTMLGLEFREYTKFAMGAVLPFAERDSAVFRSDDMDFGTYMAEIFDRSGVAGPWGLLLPTLPGWDWGTPAKKGMSLAGPTGSKIYDLFNYGPVDKRFWKEQVPFYYTIQ